MIFGKALIFVITEQEAYKARHKRRGRSLTRTSNYTPQLDGACDFVFTLVQRADDFVASCTYRERGYKNGNGNS